MPRWRLAPAAYAAFLLLAAARRASGGCPWEPLQVLGNGKYARLGTSAPTSCEERSGGACPFAVPFPDYPCLVNCVASESDCAAANSHAPAADPFRDAHACTSCGITACADCAFVEAGRAVCRRCFDGFVGIEGPDGEFTRCVLWDHSFVIDFFGLIFAIVSLIFLVIMVATCVAAYRMTWGHMLRDVAHKVVDFGNTVTHSIEGLAHDGMHYSPSNGGKPGGDHSQPLLTHSLREPDDVNREAIRKGLMLSLMSSIKASAMRKAAKAAKQGQGLCGRLYHVLKSCFDDRMADLGLGLQLFFKTQIFLIIVALIVVIAVSFQEDDRLFQAVEASMQLCSSSRGNITAVYTDGERRYQWHAKQMQVMCAVLWVVLLIISWLFHISQKNFIEEYDKETYSAEDYTLRLDGLPPDVTSEKELKRILEHELRMRGRIYGVSICFNVLELQENGVERIEEMLDHVIEWDDMTHGWCEDHLSSSREELAEQLRQDKRDLEEVLSNGKLQGSGVAFIAFNSQYDCARALAEHRGISLDVFNKKNPRYHNPRSPTKADSAADDESQGSQEEPHVDDNTPVEVVIISKDTHEPAGLRWLVMWTKDEVRMRRKYLELPMRMVAYISVYALVAQLFYSTMIKPWQDNFIEGAESAGSVKVISKLVLLFNFAIQTVVMIDVERSPFVRISQVDEITFVWNTVLLLVTNAYMIMQDCLREGIRWDLVPPEQAEGTEAWWQWQRTSLQSTRIEKEVGQSLVGTLTDQIMMLYVLGEVANVLLPVMFNYIAIRFIFFYQAETKKTFVAAIQQRLRALLLRSRDSERITVREAERAQILVPLLLWMEYTYVVIFPAMAFVTFYLLTDANSKVAGWLLGFSIIFFIWQRYVMLWLYGKSTYDNVDSYNAFIQMWGIVLSMLPPASIWWAWRLGEILEYHFALLSMFLVYFLTLLSYEFGLIFIDMYKGARDDGVDDFGEGGDPGYEKVIEEHGMSWWNLNPVYVLKQRHCPTLAGFEVQDDGVNYWPKAHTLKGYFELGKEFKHVPYTGEEESPAANGAQRRQQSVKDEEQPAFPSSPSSPAAAIGVEVGPVPMRQAVRMARAAGTAAVAAKLPPGPAGAAFPVAAVARGVASQGSQVLSASQGHSPTLRTAYPQPAVPTPVLVASGRRHIAPQAVYAATTAQVAPGSTSPLLLPTQSPRTAEMLGLRAAMAVSPVSSPVGLRPAGFGPAQVPVRTPGSSVNVAPPAAPWQPGASFVGAAAASAAVAGAGPRSPLGRPQQAPVTYPMPRSPQRAPQAMPPQVLLQPVQHQLPPGVVVQPRPQAQPAGAASAGSPVRR